MRLILFACLAAFAAQPAVAATARPSAADLAQALSRASGKAVRVQDIRVPRVCVGPDEEPTEFECTWYQRAGKVWRRHKGWFAISGKSWQYIN